MKAPATHTVFKTSKEAKEAVAKAAVDACHASELATLKKHFSAANFVTPVDGGYGADLAYVKRCVEDCNPK